MDVRTEACEGQKSPVPRFELQPPETGPTTGWTGSGPWSGPPQRGMMQYQTDPSVEVHRCTGNY